jgi:hypothetical protein
MSSRARLALLVLVGYVVIAFAVGNRYPFSVFDMYSRPADNGSRIVARKDGQIEEVDRYVDWSCVLAESCGREGAIATTEPVDRELMGWVRAHAGDSAAAAPVELVRRTWHFEAAGVRIEDCVLQRCRAVRK